MRDVTDRLISSSAVQQSASSATPALFRIYAARVIPRFDLASSLIWMMDMDDA